MKDESVLYYICIIVGISIMSDRFGPLQEPGLSSIASVLFTKKVILLQEMLFRFEYTYLYKYWNVTQNSGRYDSLTTKDHSYILKIFCSNRTFDEKPEPSLSKRAKRLELGLYLQV